MINDALMLQYYSNIVANNRKRKRKGTLRISSANTHLSHGDAVVKSVISKTTSASAGPACYQEDETQRD